VAYHISLSLNRKKKVKSHTCFIMIKVSGEGIACIPEGLTPLSIKYTKYA